MKRLSLVIALFLVGCTPFQPATPVTIYPTPLPTPTLAVHTKPIGETDLDAAYDFFYHLKIHMASGEFEHLAEEIRYPITVNVDGEKKTFVHVAEFDANFEKIFSDEKIQKFISTDESELTFTVEGVKVADGMIWFDWICMDPTCEEAGFLITEINN
jgi:hypothetical protein